MWETGLDDLDLLAVLAVNALEDLLHQAVNDVHGLVIVLVDGHLQVHTGVLGQVTMGVAVLGTEDGADLKDTAEVGRDAHLLGQLGTLCEEGVSAKVVDLEDLSTRLGSSGLQLGSMDLDEALVFEVSAEDAADTGVDAEDGLSSGRAEVGNAVGDADSCRGQGLHLVCLSVHLDVINRVDIDGKMLVKGDDEVHALDQDLHIVNRASLDGLGGLL